MATSPKRRCQGTTKAGKPCKAAPLKDGAYCCAHDRTRSDDDRFGSPAWSSRAGASPKPHVPKLIEALAAKVEEHAEQLVQAYIDALAADRGVVVGFGENAELELVPDYAMRVRAADAIYDRLLGKPRQQTEISGPEGGPIELDAPSDHTERATRAALLLRDAGVLEGEPSSANSNGHATNGNGHR